MCGVEFCFCSDTNLRCFISFTDIRKKAHSLKLVIPVKATRSFVFILNLPFLTPCFSLQQGIGGEKRPATVDISKKPKTPKKKKRKDPNEPVKPVSAYALFFRDTQANIKAQNPNATFGEVSKIVASMWDGLGEEQKQVGSPLLI